MVYLYSQHALVEPPVLLGRRLRPFSLGHAKLLHALEHPALLAKELSRADLAVAVWICSKDWKSAAAGIRRGSFRRALFWMGVRFKTANRREAVRAFDEYIRFYISGPPRWDSDGGNEARVPWFLTLFCAIQKHSNLSAAETWALPAKAAAEICAGLGDLNGDKSLMTPGEQGFVDGVGAEE